MSIKKQFFEDPDESIPPEQLAWYNEIRRWHEKWKDSGRWARRELNRRRVERGGMNRTHANSAPPKGWDPNALTPKRRHELRVWVRETIIAVCDDPPPSRGMNRDWLRRFLQARPSCPDEVFWAADHWFYKELLDPVLKKLIEDAAIEPYEYQHKSPSNGEVYHARGFRKVNVLVALAKASYDPKLDRSTPQP